MIFPIQFMFYYILTVWRYLFIHLSIVFSCFPSTNAIADTDILHMYIIIAVIIIDKGVQSPSNRVPFFLLNRVPHTLHLYSCSLFFWCPFFTTCSWLTMPYISQFSFGHAWLWSVRFRPRFFILVFHHFQIFIKILKILVKKQIYNYPNFSGPAPNCVGYIILLWQVNFAMYIPDFLIF